MADIGVYRLHKRQRRGTKGTGETKAPKLSARQKKSMRNRKEYVKRTLAAKESFLDLAKEARAKLGPALAKFLRNGKKSLTPLAADPSNVTDKEAMLFQRAQVVNKFLELQIESNNEKRLVNQRACANFFDVSTYLVASWTRQFLRSEPRPLQETPAAQGQAVAALPVAGRGAVSGGAGGGRVDGGGMGDATSAAAAATTELRSTTATTAQGEDSSTLPVEEGGEAHGAGPGGPLTAVTSPAASATSAAVAAQRTKDGGKAAGGEGGRGGAHGAGPGGPLTAVTTPAASATSAAAAAAAQRTKDGGTAAGGEGGRGGAHGKGPGGPLTAVTTRAASATAPAAGSAAAAQRTENGGTAAAREGGRGGRARGRSFVDTMPTYQGGGDVPPKEPAFSELNAGYPSELIPEAAARRSSLRFVSIGM